MFKIFEIKEGKFTAFPQLSSKKIKGFFIISAVIAIISLFSGWLNISEKQLWKYYQLLLEQLNLKYELPELKNNQDKLDARVELAVDRALTEVTPEYDRIIAEADKRYNPRYKLIGIIRLAKILCCSLEVKRFKITFNKYALSERSIAHITAAITILNIDKGKGLIELII